jgi:hypothetical protein
LQITTGWFQHTSKENLLHTTFWQALCLLPSLFPISAQRLVPHQCFLSCFPTWTITVDSSEMDSFKQISVIPGHWTLGFHDSMKCMTKSCFGNLLFLWSIMVYWQYGKDYDYDAPVKLLDKLLHAMSETDEEQLVVVSQVLSWFIGLQSLI